MGLKLNLNGKLGSKNKHTQSKRTILSAEEDINIDLRPGTHSFTSGEATNEPHPLEYSSIEEFISDFPAEANETALVLGQDSDPEPGPVYNVDTHPSSKPKRQKITKIEKPTNLEPFIKQTYFPDPNLEHDSAHETRVYLLKHNIVIENSDVSPVQNWCYLNLPLPLTKGLEAQGFFNPTPIQSAAVPIIMSGRDLLGIAPTGSGKTVAYVLPLCRHVLANQDKRDIRKPVAVVLSPTRELCIQIYERIQCFTQELDLYPVCCYGGSDISQQISKIVSGHCDIIIATPGRLIDLLVLNHGRVLSMDSVSFLVIDEVDRMCDLGFQPQMRSILSAIRSDRQSVVFSATVGEQQADLVDSILQNPARVTINRNSVVDTVHHEVYLMSENQKLSKLLEILNEEGLQKIDDNSLLAIIFVDTQSKVDFLTLQLVSQGIRCMGIHGGMDQNDRQTTFEQFRNGEFPVLIATSIAARGIDLRRLQSVINYDAPSHIEDYIHRAGRTGRAGETGRCYTFLTTEQSRQAYELSSLLEVSQKITDMAKTYEKKISRNKKSKNVSYGFGGYGLQKLDIARETKRSVESEVFASQSDEIADAHTSFTAGSLVQMLSPNSYYARLPINGYSKQARVAATAPARQTEVVNNYNVSLTLRGEYQKRSENTKDNLHILIEGRTEDSVFKSYMCLLKVLQKEQLNTNKFTTL